MVYQNIIKKYITKKRLLLLIGFLLPVFPFTHRKTPRITARSKRISTKKLPIPRRRVTYTPSRTTHAAPPQEHHEINNEQTPVVVTPTPQRAFPSAEEMKQHNMRSFAIKHTLDTINYMGKFIVLFGDCRKEVGMKQGKRKDIEKKHFSALTSLTTPQLEDFFAILGKNIKKDDNFLQHIQNRESFSYPITLSKNREGTQITLHISKKKVSLSNNFSLKLLDKLFFINCIIKKETLEKLIDSAIFLYELSHISDKEIKKRLESKLLQTFSNKFCNSNNTVPVAYLEEYILPAAMKASKRILSLFKYFSLCYQDIGLKNKLGMVDWKNTLIRVGVGVSVGYLAYRQGLFTRNIGNTIATNLAACGKWFNSWRQSTGMLKKITTIAGAPLTLANSITNTVIASGFQSATTMAQNVPLLKKVLDVGSKHSTAIGVVGKIASLAATSYGYDKTAWFADMLDLPTQIQNISSGILRHTLGAFGIPYRGETVVEVITDKIERGIQHLRGKSKTVRYLLDDSVFTITKEIPLFDYSEFCVTLEEGSYYEENFKKGTISKFAGALGRVANAYTMEGLGFHSGLTLLEEAGKLSNNNFVSDTASSLHQFTNIVR